MSDKIKQRLQQLEELYAQQELINIQKQEAIDKILPPELKAAIGKYQKKLKSRILGNFLSATGFYA